MYTDYGPPWSDVVLSSPAVSQACCEGDTGLLGWVQTHPLLALALAAGAALLLTGVVKPK